MGTVVFFAGESICCFVAAAPCAIRGGALETMVIDSGVEPRREVQEHANLSYDCHCNRIFLPDSSIHLAPRATPSKCAAHLSIREQAPSAFRSPPSATAFFSSLSPRSPAAVSVFPPPGRLANLASTLGGNRAAMGGRVSSTPRLPTGGALLGDSLQLWGLASRGANRRGGTFQV